MPYMHPAAGDPVNALDLHDSYIAFDLYAPPETQGLCIGVAHFVVYNRMIFRYFSVCLTNQAIDYAFVDFRLIGLYGQVFITIPDSSPDAVRTLWLEERRSESSERCILPSWKAGAAACLP